MTYKIKTYIHSSVIATIDDDFIKCRNYFKAHDIDLILDIEKTEIQKYDVPVKLFTINEGKCDVVMYLYNRGTFQDISFGLAFNVSKTLRAIYLATSTMDDAVDYTWKSICHELMHTLFYKFKISAFDPMDRMLVNGILKPYFRNEELKPDGWNAPDGNYAEAWKRLAPYLNKTTYKYFNQAEVDKWQLSPTLWLKLDEARGYAQTPFKLTSGLRSSLQNTLVGGSPTSTHLTGAGCDISCTDSTQRNKMIT